MTRRLIKPKLTPAGWIFKDKDAQFDFRRQALAMRRFLFCDNDQYIEPMEQYLIEAERRLVALRVLGGDYMEWQGHINFLNQRLTIAKERRKRNEHDAC